MRELQKDLAFILIIISLVFFVSDGHRSRVRLHLDVQVHNVVIIVNLDSQSVHSRIYTHFQDSAIRAVVRLECRCIRLPHPAWFGFYQGR